MNNDTDGAMAHAELFADGSPSADAILEWLRRYQFSESQRYAAALAADDVDVLTCVATTTQAYMDVAEDPIELLRVLGATDDVQALFEYAFMRARCEVQGVVLRGAFALVRAGAYDVLRCIWPYMTREQHLVVLVHFGEKPLPPALARVEFKLPVVGETLTAFIDARVPPALFCHYMTDTRVIPGTIEWIYRKFVPLPTDAYEKSVVVAVCCHVLRSEVDGFHLLASEMLLRMPFSAIAHESDDDVHGKIKLTSCHGDAFIGAIDVRAPCAGCVAVAKMLPALTRTTTHGLESFEAGLWRYDGNAAGPLLEALGWTDTLPAQPLLCQLKRPRSE